MVHLPDKPHYYHDPRVVDGTAKVCDLPKDHALVALQYLSRRDGKNLSPSVQKYIMALEARVAELELNERWRTNPDRMGR